MNTREPYYPTIHQREKEREREEGTKPSAAKKKKLTILENLPKNKTAQK